MIVPVTQQRRWPFAAAVVLVLAFAVHAAAIRGLEDWHYYWLAGKRVLAAEPLYVESERPFGFKYSPAAAFVFAPFGTLSERTGGTLWLLLSAAALIRALQLSRRLMTPEAPESSHLMVMLLMLGLWRQETQYGQCNAVLLWLVLESEREAEKRPWLSGSLLAVACLFKLPLGLVALRSVVAREWRRVAALVVFLGIALLAVMGQLEAWRASLAATTPELLCLSTNQGLFGMACSLSPQSAVPPAWLVFALGISIAGALGLLLWRIARIDRAQAWRAALASAIYLAAVLSPLSWRANLLGLIPLLYLLVASLPGAPRWAQAVGLAPPVALGCVVLFGSELVGVEAFAPVWLLRVVGWLGVATALTATGLVLNSVVSRLSVQPTQQ